jgi:hypothetical protein
MNEETNISVGDVWKIACCGMAPFMLWKLPVAGGEL